MSRNQIASPIQNPQKSDVMLQTEPPVSNPILRLPTKSAYIKNATIFRTYNNYFGSGFAPSPIRVDFNKTVYARNRNSLFRQNFGQKQISVGENTIKIKPKCQAESKILNTFKNKTISKYKITAKTVLGNTTGANSLTGLFRNQEKSFMSKTLKSPLINRPQTQFHKNKTYLFDHENNENFEFTYNFTGLKRTNTASGANESSKSVLRDFNIKLASKKSFHKATNSFSKHFVRNTLQNNSNNKELSVHDFYLKNTAELDFVKRKPLVITELKTKYKDISLNIENNTKGKINENMRKIADLTHKRIIILQKKPLILINN